MNIVYPNQIRLPLIVGKALSGKGLIEKLRKKYNMEKKEVGNPLPKSDEVTNN